MLNTKDFLKSIKNIDIEDFLKSIKNINIDYRFVIAEMDYNLIDKEQFYIMKQDLEFLSEKEFLKKYYTQITSKVYDILDSEYNENGDFNFNLYAERNIFIDYIDNSTSHFYYDDSEIITPAANDGLKIADMYGDVVGYFDLDTYTQLSKALESNIDLNIFYKNISLFKDIDNLKYKDMFDKLLLLKESLSDEKEIYDINRSLKNIIEILSTSENNIKMELENEI